MRRIAEQNAEDMRSASKAAPPPILASHKAIIPRMALTIALVGWACAAVAQDIAPRAVAPTEASTPPLARIPVTQDGLVGELIVLDDGARHPGVLRLGGAEGGVRTEDAELLAAHGFAVLALGYFNAPGLPPDLEEIPLEYFGRAIEWMRTSPRIDADRMAVVGLSRGSALALLLPTIYPGFDAVVAMAPSHVVWQSSYIDWGRYAEHSSFSRDGRPLPFVPYDFSNEEAMNACNAETAACVRMYEISLDQRQRVEEARIPVERIGAPVLLISGRADTLWPSSMMAEQVVRSLAAANYGFEYLHLAYDDAGHCALVRCFGGGTDSGNARAVLDAEARVVDFLDRHLNDLPSANR